MTTAQETKAEVRARAMAKLLEEAGFKIEVDVEHRDAQYFSDGDVMTGARLYVRVRAIGKHSWSESYTFAFESQERSKYSRASTYYIGGHLFRGLYSSLKDKKLSLKDLRFRIASEVESARYAKSQEA
jgi:hypothetical protein